MKIENKIDCPVNFSSVNQNKVRVIAFFVFVLSAAYLIIPHWSIAGLLVTDFFLRAFGMGRYSFLAIASNWIIKKLSLSYKPIDSAAKEFAAIIGFVVSDVLFITSVFLLYDVGIYAAGLLICFSFLEAAFGFCAGCHVYSFINRFVKRGAIQNIASP
jgi:hypothetical protein